MSGSAKSQLFVGSLVGWIVRITVDFCQKKIGVNTSSVAPMKRHDDFRGSQNNHFIRLAIEKRTLRNPILDHVLMICVNKVNKNMTDRVNRASGLK